MDDDIGELAHLYEMQLFYELSEEYKFYLGEDRYERI
jgi:hypothetical protein